MKVGLLLLAVPVLVVGMFSWSSVGSGQIGVKTSFGVAKAKALNPGVHLVIPFIDRVTVYDSRTLAVPEKFSALTSDGQAVTITGILNFQVSEEHAPLIYTMVSSDTEGLRNKIIQPILLSTIKAVASRYTMPQLLEAQAKFAADVELEMRARLAKETVGSIAKGNLAIVDTFNITGFVLDPDVQASIEKTAISKQGLLTAKSDVEVAKLQAQRNQVLDASLTPNILLNAAILKWDGSGIPPTAGGNQQYLIQPNAKQPAK